MGVISLKCLLLTQVMGFMYMLLMINMIVNGMVASREEQVTKTPSTSPSTPPLPPTRVSRLVTFQQLYASTLASCSDTKVFPQAPLPVKRHTLSHQEMNVRQNQSYQVAYDARKKRAMESLSASDPQSNTPFSPSQTSATSSFLSQPIPASLAGLSPALIQVGGELNKSTI